MHDIEAIRLLRSYKDPMHPDDGSIGTARYWDTYGSKAIWQDLLGRIRHENKAVWERILQFD